MKFFDLKIVLIALSANLATLITTVEGIPTRPSPPPSTASIATANQPQRPLPKTQLQVLKGPLTDSRLVAFSAQGKLMASVGRDNAVYIQDVVTEKTVRILKLPLRERNREQNQIVSLAFSSIGESLATATSEIRVWNLKTGQLQATLALSGKDENRTMTALAFSPDDKLLAAASKDGAIRLWDVKTKQWKAIFKEKGQYAATTIAFTPDSKNLACGGAKISLWDIRRKRLVRNFSGASYDDGSPKCLAFSPDGKFIVAGGDKTPYTENWSLFDYGGFFGAVYVWDVATGHIRAKKSLKDERIYSLAYAPNGRSLAVAYSDGVLLWNTHDWQLLQSQGLQTSSAMAMSYLVDSKTLMIGARSGTVYVWTPKSLNR
jgi:WD40 repeat protein